MKQSKSEGARGYFDMETPESEKDRLEISLSTRKESLELQIEVCKGTLKRYEQELGRLSLSQIEERKSKTITEYFHSQFEGYHAATLELMGLEDQLNKVIGQLIKKTDETFETMFMRQTKNLVSPEKYQQIRQYTKNQLDELYGQV